MGRQAAPGQAGERRGSRIGDIEYRLVADYTMTRSSATSKVMAVSKKFTALHERREGHILKRSEMSRREQHRCHTLG